MAARSGAGDGDRNRVSADRAGRLYRLLRLVSTTGPAPRPQLLKRLKVGMRTFYRDIDLLRSCGIVIQTAGNGYSLPLSLDEALQRLPFPDPELSFGDVLALMKGKTGSHERLRKLFVSISR
jgi:biotin operon repressor